MSETPRQIIVIGGTGGLGRAMVETLLERFEQDLVTATYCSSEIPFRHDRLSWQRLDIRDPDAIEKWASDFKRVDWLLNFAGFLHGDAIGPEKNIQALDADFLIENIRVNTLPTLLLAKHFARALKQSPAPVMATVSARVGSIEDNRLGGWYSYRISKAALNMALKTLSIEWKHSHPKGCVAALHPGTNDTALSKPFQANVKPENLFDPAYTASMFLELLTQLGPDKSGNFWAWDGELLPW
ncbi:MAG: SDR family NAD(P)-dependent oxidoreductase [Gammaproteobacteria bacterium]|nr:SDR family NAD(P)-dependent oxidoreductase [Gammaproteobacteria bacterium]